MEGRCPDTHYCSNGSLPYSDIKPSLLLIPAYAGLVNSSLSALGAVLIVLAYCAFKDLRKGTAQTIITLLALADLGSAVAGIFGASLFIRYFNLEEKNEEECNKFDNICQIQGFVGMWAYQCSLFWTSILAIHFLLITIFHHSTWTDKLLPLYNIIAWIVPLAIALSLLVLNKIGYDYVLTWTCFIKQTEGTFDYDMIGWFIPEIIVSSLMLFGYIFTLVYIACKKINRIHPAQRINRRMLTIVLAYIILRIPDLLIFLSGLIIIDEQCSRKHTVYQFLGFGTETMVAIADTSQGWINCILYIFLSPETRRRMFMLPFKKITSRYKKHKYTQHLRTSEAAPLLGNTQNTPSTLRRARENGDTYLSFPTEFPTATTTSCPESFSRIPEIQ